MAKGWHVNVATSGLSFEGRAPANVASRENARILSYTALAVGDLVALMVAFLTANIIYMGEIAWAHGVVILTVLAPIYLGVAVVSRAYNADALDDHRAGIVRSLQAFAFAAAAILFIAYFLKASDQFSRIVFGMGVTGSVLLLPLGRFFLDALITKWLGGTPYVTVVIRDGVSYEPAEHDIVLAADELGFDPATSDPVSYHVFSARISSADRVIVACAFERYQVWASVLKSMAINGELITDEHDHLGLIGLGRHGVRRTMVVAAGPLALRDRVLKRAFDIVASGGALILLSPLLLATALAIKLESKGSALFRQKRIGRDNRIFEVLKFRSMFVDMCDSSASVLTARSDPRVTRVGEFIRKTSIDELPQLVNVLKGDMSIVGPRPHPLAAKAADQLYWDVDPRYRHRHAVKPGITGLAQIRGFRGNTERTEDLTNRLQADLEYVADWSLWKDVKIVLQTFFVLNHSNAF